MAYGIHDPQGSGKTTVPFNINDHRTWREPFVINADGSIRFRPPKNGKDYDLDELHEIVGGYIEIHRVPKTNDKWIAVMNEEGKIQEPPLSTNTTATALLALDVIVGNILICPTEMVQ